MVYLEAEVRRRQLIDAARTALSKRGVANTSIRAVAAEAGVSLGTMQYVFPTKQSLLRAVIEDVVEEIADVLKGAADLQGGLDRAVRVGLISFWSGLVSGHVGLQLMQYELTTYALRTAGEEELARWQYDRYVGVVADWCQQAAERAGESCSLTFAQLARLIVAGVDGLILQHVSAPDKKRSKDDLTALINMVIDAANVQPSARH